MLNRWCAVGLALTGLLGLGAFLVAGGREPNSLPKKPAQADPPLVIAMQEGEANPKVQGQHKAAADRGWIGVMLEKQNGGGLRVVSVFPGGPAAFAGVRVGDVLVRIAGMPADSVDVATEAIERVAPQHPVVLTIQRRGKLVD